MYGRKAATVKPNHIVNTLTAEQKVLVLYDLLLHQLVSFMSRVMLFSIYQPCCDSGNRAARQW